MREFKNKLKCKRIKEWTQAKPEDESLEFKGNSGVGEVWVSHCLEEGNKSMNWHRGLLQVEKEASGKKRESSECRVLTVSKRKVQKEKKRGGWNESCLSKESPQSQPSLPWRGLQGLLTWRKEARACLAHLVDRVTALCSASHLSTPLREASLTSWLPSI